MNIDTVAGYNIIVQLHGDPRYHRDCIINTQMDPKEIQALFTYAGVLAGTGKTVKAIKYVRQELDCSLREAKDFTMDARRVYELKQTVEFGKVNVIDIVDTDPFGANERWETPT